MLLMAAMLFQLVVLLACAFVFLTEPADRYVFVNMSLSVRALLFLCFNALLAAKNNYYSYFDR